MKVLQSYSTPKGVRVTMHEKIPATVQKNSQLMSLAGVWKVVEVESDRTVILTGGQGRPAMNEFFIKL